MKKLTRCGIAVAGLSLFACSTAQENKALDEKIAQTSDVQNSAQLDAKTKALSASAPGLSPEQRSKLATLRQQTHGKLAALREESLKVQEILVKDILDSQPHRKEIEAAKDRLRKISSERLNTLFAATDQANEVLGRNQLLRQARDVQFLEDDFNYW